MSDTHDNLANCQRIVELLNASGVERVVHTGDITQAKTLEVLARLDAPLVGVFGNNDKERPGLHDAALLHGIELVDPPLPLDLSGRRVSVVHDPVDITDDLLAGSEVVLHGHTHRRVHEERDGTLLFNPGECAGHMAGLNTVGVLDVLSLRVELLRF